MVVLGQYVCYDIGKETGWIAMGDVNAVFQRFHGAAREQVRLPLAAEAYFSGGATPEQARELERYLRRRVRALMELLIREDELPKLVQLAQKGWLNPGLTEDGLDMAIRLKQPESYVWMLRWKAEHYGFPDRDFTL